MRVVAVDTSVLVNLAHVRRIPMLASLVKFEFVIPDEVVSEILDVDQREAVESALDSRVLQRTTITDLAITTLYADLRRKMGRGEAACLALAASNGWIVACDERRAFRREATARLGTGRLLTTPGLLVLAIRAEILTIDEADEIKAILEGYRFRMKFDSFREFMPE